MRLVNTEAIKYEWSLEPLMMKREVRLSDGIGTGDKVTRDRSCHTHIENLRRLCRWLERLRQRCNQPIIINSAYRSPQVNKAVGSSDESQEPFDELLIEQSAKSIWVHFAVRPEGNRRKIEFLKK